MWKFIGVFIIVIGLTAFLITASSGETSSDATAESSITENLDVLTDSSNVSALLPECVIDLDCGQDGDSGNLCWNSFIVTDYFSFRCIGAGSRNGSCVNETRREFLDWCRPDEECVPGKRVCQPRISCDNGVKDQGEAGVDCGGPCKHCNSCTNGVRDGDEAEVDCGGSCPACFIECDSNASCGMPRWNNPYCGEDHSVYQDYVIFTCANPGTYYSFCRQERIRRLTDYCGPLNKCVAGRCADDRDREPYAYVDGGYYGGPIVRPLVDQYSCDLGDSCYTKSDSYETCKGPYCWREKPPDGETKGPVGLN